MPGMAFAQDDEDQKFSPLAMLLAGIGRNLKGDPDGAGVSGPPVDGSGAGAPPPKATPQGGTADLENRLTASRGAMPVAQPELPTAPKPPDMSGRLSRIKDIEGQLAAPPPKPEDYQAHGWGKVLQSLALGAASFGSGMTHNNAYIDTANANIRRPYEQATERFDTQQKQGKTQLDAERQGMQTEREGYDDATKWFQNEMAKAREGREVSSAAAKQAKDLADAKRKDYQAMSPSERADALPEIEQGLGHKLDVEQRDQFIINGKLEKPQKDAKEDLDPAHVLLEAEPKGPKRTAKAQELFDRQHREAKDPAAKPKKPMSPNQQQMLEKSKDKDIAAAKQEHDDTIRALNNPRNRQYANLKPEDRERVKQEARQKYLSTWQDAQDKYEANIEGAGYESGHFDVASNSKVQRDLGEKEPAAKAAPKSEAAPAKGESAPAKTAPSSSGPPASLFKGEGHTLVLKNPTTGKNETWKMSGGKPQKVNDAKK